MIESVLAYMENHASYYEQSIDLIREVFPVNHESSECGKLQCLEIIHKMRRMIQNPQQQQALDHARLDLLYE